MEETSFDRRKHAVAEHVIHDYGSSGSSAVDVDVLAGGSALSAIVLALREISLPFFDFMG